MIIERIVRRLNRILFSPRIPVNRSPNVLRLGSSYGFASIEDADYLHGATIMSCGLGEDATFDIDFLHRFGGKVILVDPTPRAVAHYHAIEARFGRPAEAPRVDTGKQAPESYDLRDISAAEIVLDPVALWSEKGTVSFFAPRNPNNVSHSITNVSNSYRTDTSFLEVPAETIDGLMERHGLSNLPYLKLDIEGAEIPVLHDMLDKKILPRQICVGFDDEPSVASRKKIAEVNRRLEGSGYRCTDSEGHNYLFVLGVATP